MEISAAAFDDLRRLIKDACAIDLAPSKGYLLQSRLSPLMSDRGIASYEELYQQATLPANEDLLDAVVDAVTTNETLWFRDAGPWKILREKFLPEAFDRMASGDRRPMRIWCAACSTGQEPYSVAMLISEAIEARRSSAVTPDRFEIVATDISPSALFTAMAGRYDSLAASRGLEPAVQKRYFEEDRDTIVVKPEVRSFVDFRRFNLMDDFARLGRFDLILCRNVLIYFDGETRRGIVDKISSALRPTGGLILGGAESLQGAMRLFKLSRVDNALYYASKQAQEQGP